MTSRGNHRYFAGLCALVVALLTLTASKRVEAQAWNYPSMQLPYASTRDYTGAIVGASGVSAVFQWREGVGDGLHLGVDAGFADPRGKTAALMFVGGSIGSELLRSTAQQPLDLLLSGGIGVAFGGKLSLIRIPVGTSVGHRFALPGNMALTPYAHPRVSIDICTRCEGTKHQSELSLNFDLGLNYEFTPNFAVRAGGSFSGSDLLGKSETFVVGLVWSPIPITKK